MTIAPIRYKNTTRIASNSFLLPHSKREVKSPICYNMRSRSVSTRTTATRVPQHALNSSPSNSQPQPNPRWIQCRMIPNIAKSTLLADPESETLPPVRFPPTRFFCLQSIYFIFVRPCNIKYHKMQTFCRQNAPLLQGGY